MTDPDALQERLAQLRQVYLSALPERARQFREAQAGLANGALPVERIRVLRVLAHQLAGSGGAYGFPDISASARAVETALLTLESGGEPGPDRAHAGEAIAELCAVLERHGVAGDHQSPPKRP